jgi:hypothetical protein
MIPGLQPVDNSVAHPAPKATGAYPGKGRLDGAETGRQMARPSPWIRAFRLIGRRIRSRIAQSRTWPTMFVFLPFKTIYYMTFFEKIKILKKNCRSSL